MSGFTGLKFHFLFIFWVYCHKISTKHQSPTKP